MSEIFLCPDCKVEMTLENNFVFDEINGIESREMECQSCHLWRIGESNIRSKTIWNLVRWTTSDRFNGEILFEIDGETAEECFRKLKLRAFE